MTTSSRSILLEGGDTDKHLPVHTENNRQQPLMADMIMQSHGYDIWWPLASEVDLQVISPTRGGKCGDKIQLCCSNIRHEVLSTSLKVKVD